MRFAALALLLSTSSALAGGVVVPIDEARTVTFAKPVTTVFVGNPAIADINMVDAHHAFVLGKAYGNTNIIALDDKGRPISNTIVSVMENHGSLVTVYHGVGQQTLACAGPRCQESPTPGDAGYKDKMDDVGKHHELGTKAAMAQPSQ
jgi:Pilus formation protein N terminal region